MAQVPKPPPVDLALIKGGDDEQRCSFVLLCGLVKQFSLGVSRHDALAAILAQWLAEQLARTGLEFTKIMPGEKRPGEFSIVTGKVSFLHPDLKDHPSFEGHMVYGTFPWRGDEAVLRSESLLRSLVGKLTQDHVECHMNGVICAAGRRRPT